MWNRLSGKVVNSKDDSPSQITRRNNTGQRHTIHRSNSIESYTLNKKTSPGADDRDPRGFDPTSTSYSSFSQGQQQGPVSTSVATSYATTSGNKDGEPYMAPGLVRNVSLADQMPRSGSSRSSRDQDQARDFRDKKWGRKERSDGHDLDAERRQQRDRRSKKDMGLTRAEKRVDEDFGTSRGPDDFPDQVASSDFSQFPGQYDGAIPGLNGATHEHPAMSSHVQDQFPGQFPTQSSAPYRPPLAASEGGPGLAAEYYGDAGQSVAEQPGNRANTPSLIIGAEPHLQPALAVAAPPPEPSASGGVGAAASFFSGEFEADEVPSTHGQQNSSTYVTGQIRPSSNHNSSSTPVISTIDGTAIGSTAGYLIDSQISSDQQRPHYQSSIGGAPSAYSSIAINRPPSEMQDSHYSSTSQPPKPGKQSSQLSSMPMYAAGVAGAAGLAAAAYGHNHHSSNQDFSSTSQHSTTSMAQRHRNHGPLSVLVNFFKDPEGVAQFEEYSQVIGVCRHCFAPGSSPKDAPRKHFYGRRRSTERYGISTRVDKDNRYCSSENEGRRKKESWLATGLGGYGFAKVGETLFNGKDDSSDTYSMKTSGVSSDGRDRRAKRQSRSKDRIGIGIISDGKSDRRGPRFDISNGTKARTYSTRRHSRPRSRSKDRETGWTGAAVSAALGASVIASSSQRHSRSPRGISVNSKHMSQALSPERRHKTKKKKRDKGFFSFGNGSTSSSSVDLAYTVSQNKHRSSKRSTGKSKDDKKAEAALLGIGAAAAALALNDGRPSHRKKGVRELVGVKETRDHDGHGSAQAYASNKTSGNQDDELWESAAEDDYESINSDLAYSAPLRRDSRASISSDSSGTNKWGWRWGSKKNRRASSPRRKSSDHGSFPAVASVAGAAFTSPEQRHDSAMASISSLPLQHVYPVPTSDPSRFDVGPEEPIASLSRPAVSSRPEAVPLQHPRPIAPVSAAIYSSQTAYDHSYSAPTGVAVFSETPYYHYPGASDAPHSTHETSKPGSLPRLEQHADDSTHESRIRRRDSSPARYGVDSKSNSMVPRRRTSMRDDFSAVRFDLTEEQEERDRRERRRKRKQDKERREAEEQEQTVKIRRASKEDSTEKGGSKTKSEEVPERSEKSWVGPAAAGIIGAAIGSAAAKEKLGSEETREERRERRRRERELEDKEDALNKSERRRRQQERDDQEAAIKERGRLPDEISASSEYMDYQGHSPKKQDMSVWQEAASSKRSSCHEDYGAFFTPLELLNKSSDQVKITSANADADIDLEQVPQIVTVEPKRIHDLSDSPAFSFADTDDKVDPSKPSFPWQIPRLKLVEPTPPSTRGSTPIPRPEDASDEGFEEPRKERPPSKVKWADDQTREYTTIAPKEDRDDFVEPPSREISGTDPVGSSRDAHDHDFPDDKTYPSKDSTMESRSASYGEDAEFALTLAFTAEDAGFDPSIVIDNPTYRRRDSPPGSNERSMPSGFDAENEPRLKKRERKRKEKTSRYRSQNDGPNGRDEGAIVQDIISQVEESESQPSDQVSPENLDNKWESIKKTEETKSEKVRKESEPEDKFVETSKLAREALESKKGDVYESSSENVGSIPSIKERDSPGFNEAVSTVSSPSTTEASEEPKPKSKDKRKSSIWNRVLGKSTASLLQENGSKDITEKAILEGVEEPGEKNKNSRERKSSHDKDDDCDSKEQNTTAQVLDKNSHDLLAKGQGTNLPLMFSDAGSVAKYLDHGVELEQVEERQPESFLEMRPEPPRPPDTRNGSEEVPAPLETTSLPTSPRANSETQNRRFSEAEISDPSQTTAVLPSSPTAVPFHFRRPARSSSSEACRDPSPKATAEEYPHHSPSTLKSETLDAVFGGSAAVALNDTTENNDPLRQELSRQENEDFERGLDDMALDAVTYPSWNDTLDQEDDYFPQKAKKAKKNKRKASQLRQETVQPLLAGTAEATQSLKAVEIEPLSPEVMRQIQEQDAQDALDSWSPSVRPSTKGKKGKKGKGKALVEKLLEENAPSPNIHEPPRDNLETTVSVEGQESDSLTRQMSRKQVVDIVTAAAQDANHDQDDAWQPTAVVEKNRGEPKGEENNKGQESLPQDDLQTKTTPQDELLPEIVPRDDHSQENVQHHEVPQVEAQRNNESQGNFPQVNLPQDDLTQSQKPGNGSLQGGPRSDRLPVLTSSTPATVTFGDPFLEHGHEILSESPKVNPVSQKLNHGDLTTVMPPQLEHSPRAIPLPNCDDDHDLLDERLRTPTPTSLDHFNDKGKETATESPLGVPYAQDSSAYTAGPQWQSQDLPYQAEQVDAGKYSAAPLKENSQRGKKAKQSFSVKDNEFLENQERDGLGLEVVTSTKLEDDWQKGASDEPAIEVPEEKSETVEDGSGDFNSRKRAKEEKKATQSLSAKNSKTTEIQEGQQLPPYIVASEVLEDHESMKSVDESTVDFSQPKTGPLENESLNSDGKETGKQVEKQRSNTLHLEPRPDETDHQSERQPNASDDFDDRHLSLATTRTSQEVSAMLGLDENEVSVIGESKEVVPSESQGEHDLRKLSEDRISGRDERNLPVLDEPENIQHEDAPRKARDDERLPNLDTLMAGTNPAPVVQDILAGENNAESATDAKSEIMAVPTGMEETKINTPMNEEGMGWDGPKKKKKGRKGKKNEASSWDEPETIEPAEIPVPPGVMDTPLEQEPAADRPKEEDEVDHDTSKKKKKGKKGKKNEAFSWDEPEMTEPAGVTGQPAAPNPLPLEQEPAVKSNCEVFSKQSKKDKKNKKGKGKGLSRAMSDFRDEDEPHIVPAEVPQDEDKAEDLPVIASGFQEGIGPGFSHTEIPQDDEKAENLPQVSQNDYKPSLVPTTIMHNEDHVVDRSAIDRPLVTSNFRGEAEPNSVPTEAPPDDTNVKDFVADRMPPMRAEGDSPEEMSEPALPIILSQQDRNEESRETPLEQEQSFMPPKGKKEKRKSKKSKKSSAFSLDDGEAPALEDGQIAGINVLEKDEPSQTVPSSVDIIEESEKTTPEIRLEQEEDFMLPMKRKNKKKSKKSSAFSPDRDVLPVFENEPVFKSKDLEQDIPEQTFPSSVGVVKVPGTFLEGLPEQGKDREGTEEAQPFDSKTKDITAQSEPETAQGLNKDSENDSNINTLNVLGDLGMVGGKREEVMHGDLDSISAHVATQGVSSKTPASMTPSLELPPGALEETPAYNAEESKGDILPAVATDVDTFFSPKPSKKDKTRAKNARQLTREEDEVSQEPRAIFNEPGATEDGGRPSMFLVSQRSESWSQPEVSTQGNESTGIVQPGMGSEEDGGHRKSIMEEMTSQARDDNQKMVKANQEDSFANVKNGEKGERTNGEKFSISKPEADRSHAYINDPAWATATDTVQRNGLTSEQQHIHDMSTAGPIHLNQERFTLGSEKEQTSSLTEPGTIDDAKDKDLSSDVSVQIAKKPEGHYEAQRHKPSIEDLSSSTAPGPVQETVETARNTETVTDVEPLGSLAKVKLIPTNEVKMLDAQEQREYNEEYARESDRAILDAEPVADLDPLGGSGIEKSIPAVEVGLLDAQEQRNYNDEYAKELERQLSPLQEGERANSLRDEANTPVFSPASIGSVMERPYEEEYRPLARPPALEDIIEESRSRPGSFHGNPVDREDEPSPIKSTKKGKKGKKGKKQQPIIWEDETATPPLGQESDQRANSSVISSGRPDSWNADAVRPLDLEEPVEQHSVEDRTVASPIGDSNTAHNKSEFENDRSIDYFAIHPSRPAEEDVGSEDTQEFRRALATEPPFTSKARSLIGEAQSDQDEHLRDGAAKAHNQGKAFAPHVTDFDIDARTEAEPAEEQVEDDFNPTPIKSTERGTKAEEYSPAREPSPKALEQEDVMGQHQNFRAPNADNMNERPPSRQSSLQPPSHEEKPSSVAEVRSTSPSKSGGIEGAATAMGLGVGALAAESLSRRDSKKEKGREKRAKEAGRWTEFEAETREPENPLDDLDRGEMAVGEREHRQIPESERPQKAWQHHQATLPQSPPSANYRAVADYPVVGNLSQSSETSEYRDSAIYVPGSPIISEETPDHRAIRDSGYPDTEASPSVDVELHNRDAPPELERDVAAKERSGHVQRRHSPAHETYERQRSTSPNPLEISVEASSDYDVSIARPSEIRKGSRRRSGSAYDSDDSADSGFDVQRRRRRQAMAAEPREPSPVSSTTKDRSSALFDSSPSAREEAAAKAHDHGVLPRYDPVGEKPAWSFDRARSPQERSLETSRKGRLNNIAEGSPKSTGYSISTGHHEATGTSLFGGPQSYEDDVLSPSRSPRSSESRGRRRLNTISENSPDGSPLHKKDKRAISDVGSSESSVKGRRMRSPPVEDDAAGEYVSTQDPMPRQPWPAAEEEGSRSGRSDQVSALSSVHSGLAGATSGHGEGEYRSGSAASMQSEKSIHAIIRTWTPDQLRSASGLSYPSSGTPTPPLRRVDRSASGDLRGASKKDAAKSRAKSQPESEIEIENKIDPDAESDIGIPSSSTYDPVTDKGKSRADMADVYEGWGDVRGQSPMSPTRPPSMRKRQSMQLLDLETRLDQLVSENRLLASQKLTAERTLQEQARDHSQERHAYEEAMQEHNSYLTRKDSELGELKKIIEHLHDQAAHLTEVNEGLASSRGVDEEHEQRYSQLQAEHVHAREQWQQSTRELENLKEQHTQLSTGMEDIVRHEVTVALEEKNLELRQLQSELENAKQQVRTLQQQLLASRGSNDFVERDEDYFDSRCQSLCQHVQQWVLRFSKFSDMKACYLAREIQDEKVVDRMENAILDGSDVDDYLSDRVKRRDVFMSVVMTMIWEFIFTRYLFGMDREQRQKLKNLEKTLQEVGPISAVHKWRATTLTLLMKREAFDNQRATDTEAVVHEIYDTLATFLPPPSHLVGQIQDSLRKVIDTAVDLSIEMRTQRAEYSMLPPLQPEYDTNGDLARKVYFSALTMNERSGATSSNEALQEQHAVVRMVLFPLVVKNEDDDEQIVVCPAQVLTAEGSKGKKTVRVLSAQGGRSETSFAGSDVRLEGGMI